MNRRSRVLIIICYLFFSCYSSKGQHLLDITIKGISQPEAEVTLVYWGLMKPAEIAVDSLRNGHVAFRLPADLKKSVLSIVFRGLPQLKEFRVFYNGDDIKLNLEFHDNPQNMDVTGNGDTPLYYSTLSKLKIYEERIKSYRELISGYKGSNDFMRITRDFYKKEIFSYDSIYIDLNRQYKGAMFCNILNSLRYYFPDAGKSDGEQRQEVLDHYYDYFNPGDTLLLQSSLYMYKLEDFLNMIVSLPSGDKNENLIREIIRYFDKMNSADEPTRVVVFLMQNWLNNHGFDSPIQYIDENILSKGCTAGKDLSLQNRLEAYKLMAPGKPAPELTWMGLDKIPVSSYSINTDFTLTLFWATWCPHCQAVLPELYKYIKSKPNCKVIAIGLDDDLPSWLQSIKSYPEWIHLQAPGQWNNDWVRLYGVSSSPTIYLSDRNHLIIKKVIDLNDLKKILESR